MSVVPAALVFDCYGTLMQIGERLDVTRRYARLAGRTDGPSPMTEDVGLAEALIARGIDEGLASRLGHDTRVEASSAEPLAGALRIMALASEAGISVMIASNLSREYAPPIRRYFEGVPLVLSFEVGCAKPSARMYNTVHARLGNPDGRIVMIGDSRRCDHDGAMASGMDAILLSRIAQEGAVTMPDMDAVADWLTKNLEDRS